MQTIEEIKTKTTPILTAHGITYAAVFGSYVKGTAGPESDIDILVRFSKTPGLFKFVGIEQELGKILGKKVDLVTVKFLSPYFRDAVTQEAKILYER